VTRPPLKTVVEKLRICRPILKTKFLRFERFDVIKFQLARRRAYFGFPMAATFLGYLLWRTGSSTLLPDTTPFLSNAIPTPPA
jgi:hypothetical protein